MMAFTGAHHYEGFNFYRHSYSSRPSPKKKKKKKKKKGPEILLPPPVHFTLGSSVISLFTWCHLDGFS